MVIIHDKEGALIVNEGEFYEIPSFYADDKNIKDT